MQTTFLDVQHLTKSIGSRVLFEDISFSIAEKQHIGLVAKNGTGKSTLLKLLVGDEKPDSGDIIFRNDIHVGYLEQTPQYNPTLTVLEACLSKQEMVNEELKLKAIQFLSFFEIDDKEQLIGTLSGGQVKRVALASVLIQEPDLLILDEPTNHLDLKLIEWLEDYLMRYAKALLMVTHDRYFLNRVCSVILELENTMMFTYRGNYENFIQRRADRLSAEQSSYDKMKNLYRKELDWMRRMPQARGGKAKYRQDAFREIENKLKNQQKNEVSKMASQSAYIGSKIFEANYVSKSFYDEDTVSSKVILKDFYYNFSRYEKMGIIGDNGTGKSTFIKLLLGLIKPDSGKFVIGETVKFGYFSQQGMNFDENMKVIDAVKQYAEYICVDSMKISAMQLLTQFLFPPSRQQDYIYKLSGGEKRRLYLCTILMQSPNFLILDEPTNDLDIETLQVLEHYLYEFKGCVIIISHDRYFMDKIVDHILVFKGNGSIEDFPGNYSHYRTWLSLNVNEEKGKDITQKVVNNKTNEKNERSRKLTYKEKKEFEELEQDIAKLEEKKTQLEQNLCSGNLAYEEVQKQSQMFEDINAILEEKELRWLELSEIPS